MSPEWKKITTPMPREVAAGLRTGDLLLLDGIVYAARDRAHERLCDMAVRGESLPFDARDQLIYYMGPSPAPAGRVIGSAGPTSSYRMDPFTEQVLKSGIRGMIGKGRRDRKTRDLLSEYGAVYFSTFGGAGAYLSQKIVDASVIAFDDLGPEAVYRLVVEDFPLIVVNDTEGGDLYEDAIRKRK